MCHFGVAFLEADLLVSGFGRGVDVLYLLVFNDYPAFIWFFIKFIIYVIRIKRRNLNRLLLGLQHFFGLVNFLAEFRENFATARTLFSGVGDRLLTGRALRDQVLRNLLVKTRAGRSFSSTLSGSNVQIPSGGAGDGLGLPRLSGRGLFGGLALHELFDHRLRRKTLVLRLFRWLLSK